MKKNLNKISVLILMTVFFSSALATFVNAQEELPEVINGIPKHIPLKVEFINEKEPETLKHLRIKLTNTGDRNIYQIKLWVTPLDAIASNGKPYAITTTYGAKINKVLDFQKEAEDDPLEPNESCILSVSKGQAESFKEADAIGDIPYPKKFLIEIEWLSFGDGTGFLGTNGSSMDFKGNKKVSQKSKHSKLLDQNYFAKASSTPKELFNKKISESPSCNKPLGDFSFSKFLTDSISFSGSQLNSSNPYYCCPGNDCQQARVVENSALCCPPDNNGNYEWISTLETPGTITCRAGYSCLNVTYRVKNCPGHPPCGYEPQTFPCGSQPPCTLSYRPPGVQTREGDVGYEYECYDGIDNDCDAHTIGGGIDCGEPRCRTVVRQEECNAICDADGDGIKIKACQGNDCFPQNPSLPVESETVCTDGIDEDCDDKKDCADSDCSSKTECIQQCDQDGDGFLKPDCDDDDEDKPADCNDGNPDIPYKINGVITEICGNGQNDDCDEEDADCDDEDCRGTPACPNVTPTPTPDGTPGGGEDPTPDPCMGDECCGRGTHTEVIEGDCWLVETCEGTGEIDPYTEEEIVICGDGVLECDPDQYVEVCN